MSQLLTGTVNNHFEIVSPIVSAMHVYTVDVVARIDVSFLIILSLRDVAARIDVSFLIILSLRAYYVSTSVR